MRTARPGPPGAKLPAMASDGRGLFVQRVVERPAAKLLEQAAAGRQPDSDVTVPPGCSTSTCRPAGSDMSTRKTNIGYIRWTIKPAFGSTQVRKVRGPLTEYVEPRVLSAHHVRALRMGLAKA